ncbi:DUF4091 domain-containing protein [Panacibacter sp. DH6]|uniref:DUF4091 domain-containing protein n=1 Tax=Panacibacter microcysteis TaxID=2793269 RepID=A0A931GXH6_9BACT|nr:DUF4091 domain-containing protein [Panacibacter microcysteis]MBG9375734.1 DUF4091 domain-containing protein [Panacibacter microcysteis]
MLLKVRYIFTVLFFFTIQVCKGQHGYKEYERFGDLDTVAKPDMTKWALQQDEIIISAVNLNERVPYKKQPAQGKDAAILASAWKGENVSYELVVSTKRKINRLNVSITDFKSIDNKVKVIDREMCSVGYVHFVLADNSRGVCKKKEFDYEKVILPDIIDFNSSATSAEAFSNSPIWVKLRVPANTAAGRYKATITVSCDGQIFKKNLSLVVLNGKMPALSNRKFFLDLWQYPLAEADYYKVKPWSDEHFELLGQEIKQLSEAGQRVITTSFFWDVFNPAVRPADEMMIKVVKTKEAKWEYHFENFDRWVTFMMTHGIKKQITCFGIAPLNYRYYYFDESKSEVTYFSQAVNGTDYKNFWTNYLRAFEQHLKSRGWFEITTLGIDEKELSVLNSLIDFIKSVNPEWKISLTGKYFPEIEDKVYNYSVISNQQVPLEVLNSRKTKGFITTYYTSCWEIFPNTFVMSDPADATWLSWNAANRNMDGYLRYAYDYWGKNVLTDTRSNFASGDNFLVYPYGNSSIRFEMLIDGIEDYEKIEKKLQNNKTAKGQQRLEQRLAEFDFKKVNAQKSRYEQVIQARETLLK